MFLSKINFNIKKRFCTLFMAFFVAFSSSLNAFYVPAQAFVAEAGIAISVVGSVICALGLYGSGKGDRERVANDFFSWCVENLVGFEENIKKATFKAGAVVVSRSLFNYIADSFTQYLDEKQAVKDGQVSIIYNDVSDFTSSSLGSYWVSFVKEFALANYSLPDSAVKIYNSDYQYTHFENCAYIDIYDVVSNKSGVEGHNFYLIGRPFKQIQNSFVLGSNWTQYNGTTVTYGGGSTIYYFKNSINEYTSVNASKLTFSDLVNNYGAVLVNGSVPSFTTSEDVANYLYNCELNSRTTWNFVSCNKIHTLYNPLILDLAANLYAEPQSILNNTYNTNQIFNTYSSTYNTDVGELDDDLLQLGAQVNALGQVVGELSDTLKSSEILGQELDITDVEIPTEITSSAIVSPEVTGFLGSFWSLFVQHLGTLFSWESGLFMPLSKPLSYLQKLVDISNWGQEEGILSKLLNIGVSNSNLFSKLANISDWSVDIGLLENLVPISANIQGLLQFPEQIYGKFQGTLQGLQQGVTNTYELIQSFDLKLVLNDFFVPSSDDFIGPCKSFAESHFSSTFLSFHEYTIPDVVGEINGKRVIFMDNRFIRDNILVIRGWLQGAFILAYILHWCFIVYKIFGKANSKFANDLMKSTGDID